MDLNNDSICSKASVGGWQFRNENSPLQKEVMARMKEHVKISQVHQGSAPDFVFNQKPTSRRENQAKEYQSYRPNG